MKKLTYPLTLVLAYSPVAVMAAEKDDPVLTMVKIDQLEWRKGDDAEPVVLAAEAWVGKDLNKLWLKADAERVDGATEEAVLEALYSRAVSTYWDFQVGLRHDFRPVPERNWLAVGFKGLAPYFFEVDSTAYLGESGQTAFNLTADYELLFTQRWVLTPEIEVNLYGRDDKAYGIGAGLSDMQAGLRLRYEIRREFAPYVGINWIGKFGATADYAKAEGAAIRETQWVAGIRAWF